MRVFSYLIMALTPIFLLITLGTGLGMRSLGIWAFQLHKMAGVSSVILGIIITGLWSTFCIQNKKEEPDSITKQKRK